MCSSDLTDVTAIQDWNPASCCENMGYLFRGCGITDASVLSRHTAVRDGVSYMAWDIDTSVTEVKGAFDQTGITSANKYPDWYPAYAAAALRLDANGGSILGEDVIILEEQ